MNTLGLDVSTRALDLVLLAENENRARHEHLPLPACESRVELARAIADTLPQPAWFEQHGVYLIAIEQPFGHPSSATALNFVLGAVIATLPVELPCWLLTPSEWKRGIGLKGNVSTQPGTEGARDLIVLAQATGLEWTAQTGVDACVALAVAYTAREKLAQAIREAAA